MEEIVSLASANSTYLILLILPFFSGMIYDFLQKGMIFEKAGNWLFKEDQLNKSITDKIEVLKDQLSQTDDETEKEALSTEILALDSEMTPTPYWKKPIGNCLKCTHVWVCIIWMTVNWIFFIPFEISDLIKFIPYLSVSYYILVNRYFE